LTGKNFAVQYIGTTGKITGTVYNDSNGNGSLTTGEAGLASRTVFLDTDNDGVVDANEYQTTTNATGQFTFTLPPNASGYNVKAIRPSGWNQTQPTANAGIKLTLAAGQTQTAVIGQTNNPVVTGVVFNDANLDGSKGSTEPGLAGVTVYVDSNKNGVKDTGELSTVTDSTGTYKFFLAPGTSTTPNNYRIRQSTFGTYKLINPSVGYYDVALTAAGQTFSGKNFGNTLNGLLKGVVFLDANGNGVKDSTETTGLGSWRVFIDSNGNGGFDTGEASVLTDASGNYQFVLAPRATGYKVRVVQQTGYSRTLPSSGLYTVVLSTGTISTGSNFGEKKV
jgi:hypothetical protein